MTPTPTAQLLLPLSGDEKARPSVKPKKVKPHHRPRRYRSPQPFLPFIPPPPAREIKRERRYSPEIVRDADHPVDYQIGGYTHEQHVKNRAARVLAGTFEPKPGVPATRAQCPKDRHETGCPHVLCRWHLWRLDGGEDGNRAGRPGLSLAPKNARGVVVPCRGDLGGERPGTTLLPRWLEPGPLPPSCALDEIDRLGRMSNEQAGRALARHRTLAARENRGALRKAVVAAKEQGIEPEDFIAALMRMGDKPQES